MFTIAGNVNKCSQGEQSRTSALIVNSVSSCSRCEQWAHASIVGTVHKCSRLVARCCGTGIGAVWLREAWARDVVIRAGVMGSHAPMGRRVGVAVRVIADYNNNHQPVGRVPTVRDSREGDYYEEVNATQGLDCGAHARGGSRYPRFHRCSE